MPDDDRAGDRAGDRARSPERDEATARGPDPRRRRARRAGATAAAARRRRVDGGGPLARRVLAQDRRDRPRAGRGPVRRPRRARLRAASKRLRTFVHHGMTPDAGRRDRRPADRPRTSRADHRPTRAAAAARHRRAPAVLRLPAGPSADELVPRGAGPDPGPGVRQPLPDREARRRGLHAGGRGHRGRAGGRSRCGGRERPPLRGGPTSRALAGGDGGDHRPAVRVVRGRGRRCSWSPTGPGRCPAPTSPGSSCGRATTCVRAVSGPSVADDLPGVVPRPLAGTGGPADRRVDHGRGPGGDRRAATRRTSRGGPRLGPAILVPLRRPATSSWERWRWPGRRSAPTASTRSTRGCRRASRSRRPWRSRCALARGRATAGAVRGPRPHRPRPARPGDPAAVRRRPVPAERHPDRRGPRTARRLETAVDDLDATIRDIRRSIFALGADRDAADLQTELTRLVGSRGLDAEVPADPGARRAGADPGHRRGGPPPAGRAGGGAVQRVAPRRRDRGRVASRRRRAPARGDGRRARAAARRPGERAPNIRERAEKLGGPVRGGLVGQGTTITWSVPLG